MSRPARVLLVAAACAATLTVAACGSPAPAPSAPAPSVAPSPTASSGISVTDPWVKSADGEMTAVFGTFTALGSTPVTIVSAQTSASPRTELHEVVMSDGAMKMRPKQGGFVVEPGTPHTLAPGGDHIMIMDLASPIRAGDQVEVTLNLADGTTTSFTALAKDTTGGEENYESSAPDTPTTPASMAPGHGG
jgi:copper(I)-binding protein